MGAGGSGLGDEAAVRRKIIRATGTIVLFTLLALGVCASAASAEPLSMTFTEARANVGVQLSDEALFKAPDTAPFEAQIDPGERLDHGRCPAGSRVLHPHHRPPRCRRRRRFRNRNHRRELQPGDRRTHPARRRGRDADGRRKECTVSTTPSPLVLSTAGNSGGTSPRSGAPFIHGLTGAGAIAGQWTDMSADTSRSRESGSPFAKPSMNASKGRGASGSTRKATSCHRRRRS